MFPKHAKSNSWTYEYCDKTGTLKAGNCNSQKQAEQAATQCLANGARWATYRRST